MFTVNESGVDFSNNNAQNLNVASSCQVSLLYNKKRNSSGHIVDNLQPIAKSYFNLTPMEVTFDNSLNGILVFPNSFVERVKYLGVWDERIPSGGATIVPAFGSKIGSISLDPTEILEFVNYQQALDNFITQLNNSSDSIGYFAIRNISSNQSDIYWQLGDSLDWQNNRTKLDTSSQTWIDNKYFGGGIKSFRYNCTSFNCSSHPHNYYLEILSELGLVGFFLILIVFFKVLFNSFLNLEAKKHPLNYDKIIIPFMFLFFIEIFPIKSTGSFFTTGNATYLFLIMSITIALTPTSKGKI